MPGFSQSKWGLKGAIKQNLELVGGLNELLVFTEASAMLAWKVSC